MLGLIINYLVAVIYAYFIYNYHLSLNYDLIKLISILIVPFIIFDILKAILASFISIKIKRIILEN